MATKPKTKANRAAERRSSRSQAVDRKRAEQTSAPGALDLLEQDHRQVEELFAQYDELKEENASKEELAQKICLALEVHAQIEEEVFYPKARKATKDNELINESLVEHATVKNLISEIEEMDAEDELYDAKVRVLGEMVKHHIHEEEQELFPEVEAAEIDLEALGKEISERKEALMSAMEAE
ncbi:MAG: hemerythrin domain-containing protein [Acetobacteraceae bacterium]|nr:hemerythrin domain-containing protein [Acetobacteraceae bacterium]